VIIPMKAVLKFFPVGAAPCSLFCKIKFRKSLGICEMVAHWSNIEKSLQSH